MFASIWNVFFYISDFGVAANIVGAERNSRDADEGAVVLLAVGAVVVAVLLSYVTFRAGRSKALGEERLKDEDL